MSSCCGGTSRRLTYTVEGQTVLLLRAHLSEAGILTLLRGDTGILLTFSSPVRHRLETAGAYGMASLKRAHVFWGC